MARKVAYVMKIEVKKVRLYLLVTKVGRCQVLNEGKKKRRENALHGQCFVLRCYALQIK